MAWLLRGRAGWWLVAISKNDRLFWDASGWRQQQLQQPVARNERVFACTTTELVNE
jgi:hypothetical protein